MNKLLNSALVLIFVAVLSLSDSTAKAEEKDFDFLLALTQQDMNMDWWYAVPAQFGPKIAQVSQVSKGEIFKVLPIFNNYGLSENKAANISYSVEIIAPDGSVDEKVGDINGYSAEVFGPFLLPATSFIAVAFDPEDMFGEYDVRVTAYDHIKNQKAFKNQKITLQKYDLDKQDVELTEWFLSYPSSPKPALALKAYISPKRAYFDKDGTLLWSALWFFKTIYSDNEFLISHTVDFFNKKANLQQKKDILLLFHLLNRINEIAVTDDLRGIAAELQQINIPDPYQEINSGSQLDMLWAEYFATSKIKPIKHIMTALNLSAHSGTIEKFKSGELENSGETRSKIHKDAVFQSALWSIMSNCRQSELLFQYCVGLYESKELNEIEKRYLGMMLRKLSEENQKSIQPDDRMNNRL